MAMYLGNKPVKAIARSKNNLFDISKVTGIRSYATDRDESDWFTHNGNILKIGRSAYNSVVVLSGIEFYLTEGTYSLSFKVCNNENEKMSIRSALYLSGDYPYKSLGVGYTDLLPHSSTTIIRTFTVTTAGTYYISIQPANVEVTSWIRNVLFYNIQFNPGDPLPYEPYNQLFTAPIKKIMRTTNTVTFDGTEDWFVANSPTFPVGHYGVNGNFKADVVTNKYGVDVICNHYSFSANGLNIHKSMRFAYGNANIMYFSDKDYPTLEEWKAHLAELANSGNPVTVTYRLRTPVIDGYEY